MALPTPFDQAFADRLSEMRDSMHTKFFDAFGKANIVLDTENLTKEIIASLNKERREIVLKLLGMTDKWGKLEVNSGPSNDRTIIDGYLRGTAAVAVNEWLNKHFASALEDHVRQKFSDSNVRKAAIKSFDDYFRRELDDGLRKAASNMANEVINEFKINVRETMKLGAK